MVRTREGIDLEGDFFRASLPIAVPHEDFGSEQSASSDGLTSKLGMD